MKKIQCYLSECGYSANVEAAPSIVHNETSKRRNERIGDTRCRTIEDLCEFLNIYENTCKAVVYQKNEDDSYIVAFIRGDLDINETKLVNALGCDIHPAEITADCELNAGFIGPVGLSDKITVLFDNSLKLLIILQLVQTKLISIMLDLTLKEIM